MAPQNHKRARERLGDLIYTPLAAIKLLWRSMLTRWQIGLLKRRELAVNLLGEPDKASPPRQRVLAVITHVVSEPEAKTGAESKIKLERLLRTLDGAQQCLAHCNVTFVMNTCPGRHLVAVLPEHLRRRIEVIEQCGINPMNIEFLVPDLFLARREQFDWFLFLEDDLVLSDSCLLDKLALFNRAAGDPLCCCCLTASKCSRATRCT